MQRLLRMQGVPHASQLCGWGCRFKIPTLIVTLFTKMAARDESTLHLSEADRKGGDPRETF